MFKNFNLPGGLSLGSPANFWRHLGLLMLWGQTLGLTPLYAKDDVAFLAMSDGYWQVWLMDADGKNPHAITHSQYDKSRISWYPDNNSLLASGNQGELVKLTLDGKEVPISVSEKNVNDAVVSPDGLYIAYSYKPTGNIYNKLVLKNIASNNITQIAWQQKGFQSEPAFSSDSKTLYFLSGESEQTHDIWQYGVATRNLETVVAANLYNLDVAASTKGKLAFSSNRSGNYEIWVKDGNSIRKLTDDPALDGRPSWLGETMVYFESSRGGVMNIWMVNDQDKAQAKQMTFNTEGARYPLVRGMRKVMK